MSERPKVGDRVRVVYEGVLAEDDGEKTLPFLVKTEGDRYSYWAEEAWVTVIPAEPIRPKIDPSPPVRSDTAIERRLVALERGVPVVGDGMRDLRERLVALETRKTFDDGYMTGLESRLAKIERDLRHLVAADESQVDINLRLQERVGVLERQMASLRSTFHNAGNV